MMTDAQKKLVEDNYKLVYFAVNKALTSSQMTVAKKIIGYTEEDFVGEAYYALCKAAIKFNPSRGYTFSSYAVTAIERYLWRVMDKAFVNNKEWMQACSIDKNVDNQEGDKDMYNILEDPKQDLERMMIRKDNRRKIYTLLKKHAPNILGSVRAGSMKDYGKEIGVSRQRVSQRVQKEKRILNSHYNFKDMLVF